MNYERVLFQVSLVFSLSAVFLSHGNAQEENSILGFDEFLVLEEHGGYLETVAWSPDGTQLAFSDLSHIYILNLESREFVGQFDEVSGYWTPAWSPDGRYLAAVSGDEALLLDVQEQQIAHTFSDGLLFQVQAVAWSPDGDYFAAGDRNGNVVIWDAKTYFNYQKFSFNFLHSVRAISWSSDSQQIAIGTVNTSIIYWNPHSMSESDATWLDGHEDIVNEIIWLSNGSELASVSGDGTLRFWNIVTQENYEVLHHECVLGTASKLLNGQYIATGGLMINPEERDQNTCIAIWDIDARTEIPTPAFNDDVRSIDWTPHGNLLAFVGGDNRIYIWQARIADP